jgi:hypothetical protein
METVLFQVIDMLEQSGSISQISRLSPTNSQISDLKCVVAAFKDAVVLLNRSLLSAFISAKNEYIHEFKSVVSQSPDQLRLLLLSNNQRFVDTVQTTMNSHVSEYTLRFRYPALYEKLSQLLKQFQKIVHSNVDAITKPGADIDKILPDYIANFEVNSGHMFQTIQSTFSEFATTKESAANTQILALSQNVDGAQLAYSRIHYELSDFTQQLTRFGTQQTRIETVLSQLYPTATASSMDTDNGNTVVITRDAKSPVFIQNMELKDRNVNITELKQFVQNTLERNSNGILLSQYTGISSKPNFHIDVQNHRVLVFLHNVQFSPEKISMAVDMVDTISAKLSEFIVSPEYKDTIPKDVLDDINREYQSFIVQKEALLGLVKESHKKILSQIEDFKLAALDKYLSTRYASTKKQGFTCELCSIFNVGTLKGLAAHKRGCVRKQCIKTPTSLETKRISESVSVGSSI